ncbi:MAG: hypothetical protein F4Z02_05745 [Acidimicrobiia bacterium]|nr:hypothetical protein [Acidimicrobiia bacterium]MYG72134.1 hypothetical protein [Acidimicrobiia bacterium]
MRPRGWVNAIVALSVVASTLVLPASGGASLNSLGAAPAAPAIASPGPVSSASYSPAVSFTALEYPVGFFNRIFNAWEPTDRWGPTASDTRTWFGAVTADAQSGDLSLTFAIEGQHDPSGYQFCETPTTCDYVNVRVTPEGLLYLHKEQRTTFQSGFFSDFPVRTVELSATDADTPLKVYREVLVTPPPVATGCEDYGEDNPDAFTCLFLRELLPSEAPTGVDESTLRASLPGLVQDAGNYSLVFSEEFDNAPPEPNAAGCIDGISTLDNDVWTYGDNCHSSRLDSRGEPCGTVANGALVLADSGFCPGAGLNSSNKLYAKYGYFEVKYTINRARWPAYANYNFILWGGKKQLFLLDRYGVEIEDWEDYLSNIAVEIDIFEWEVNGSQDVAHQYGNSNWAVRDADILPIRTVKWSYYCGRTHNPIVLNPKLPCRNSDTFTITRGVEWTPRGYRTFIKVHGWHDEMFVLHKDKIVIENKPTTALAPGDRWYKVNGSARDQYFELVDPDDPDTVLEQVAVSHVPAPLAMGAWGYLNRENHPYIRTRMKIDYIRVWQPDDHYSNMEPVYQ